jgi:thiol-disulfide isomerase/thioredoxin
MFGRKAIVSAALLLAASAVCAQDGAAAEQKQDAKATEKQGSPLVIGSRAPELAIETWVKGDPITGFEKGRVYVVEFWATWCGPCVAGMPHLSELQKEYKDKGVTFLGVNIWDDPKNVAPFMKDRGKGRDGADLTAGDKLMGYTVAIEKKVDPAGDPADSDNGVMSRSWMKAAGRNGIPSAFLVDKTGMIAWIGHPAKIDEPLKQVVAGTWDYKKAEELAAQERKAADEARALGSKVNSYVAALKAGETEKAYGIARELVDGPAKDNAMMLNQISWFIVDPEMKVTNKDLDLAYKAAYRANELTKFEDAATLDTLALVCFEQGKVDKALEYQTKAVSLADDEMKAELQARLEQFKSAKK